MKRNLLITQLLTLSVVLFASASAHAVIGERDITNATIRRDNRDPRFVRIQGELQCKYAAENNGSPCTMSLKDVKTGKTFELQNSEKAVQLLNNGNKMVSIEGNLLNSSTINIDRINEI